MTQPTVQPSIPISRPWFGPEEEQAVAEVLRSGWVVQGPRVQAFEQRLAQYTGAPHAVATTSCTTALHLAVRACGIQPGDEILVPAFTWVSTANVVAYEGATPVFVDIDLDTFNVDPEALATAAEGATSLRGLLPVHLFGLCADMDAVQRVADRHGVWVVEDAACALGGRIHDRHAGTFGDVGCFSFHPRKSITTGEGGAATTRDADHAHRMRVLRDHGADRTDLDRHTASDGNLLPTYAELGYNYRMTDLQAAVGCVQMDRLDAILHERAEQARRYTDALSDLDGIRPPHVPAGYAHGWQAYVTMLEPTHEERRDPQRLAARRSRVMAAMQDEGVATRQGTHAAATQAYYRRRLGTRPEDFPNATLAEAGSLALPLFHSLSDGDQDRILRLLRDAL